MISGNEESFYKSSQLFFQVFSTIMSGGYTNIAVFEIYQGMIIIFISLSNNSEY